MKKGVLTIFVLFIPSVVAFHLIRNVNINPKYNIGDIFDTFQGVSVFYNGGINTVVGRNRTADGYNLGLKYQCVEFVKRYYFKRYSHKMPNSYGHAKDFFNSKLKDGQFNKVRGLIQFKNPSSRAPKVGDLLVYGPTVFNAYGHVSIVSKVNLSDDSIEIIQQNSGQFGSTREIFKLQQQSKRWKIMHKGVLGWLSLPDKASNNINQF
ncbi:Trypanothione synthetase domain protein [hydrothermal vent metagenome]|uniref:Trypanothione synthetase domain protein n=1 Tax=hydrothermal vent metagenome TaxID=652676 RepID=A0A3B0YPN9_9ZZZZ